MSFLGGVEVGKNCQLPDNFKTETPMKLPATMSFHNQNTLT